MSVSEGPDIWLRSMSLAWRSVSVVVLFEERNLSRSLLHLHTYVMFEHYITFLLAIERS